MTVQECLGSGVVELDGELGFPIGVGNDGERGGMTVQECLGSGVVELDGEFHVADVLGKLVDGVD